MRPEQIVEGARTHLAQATEHFKQELSKIRTGRAHPGMLDGIIVEAYSQRMPLKAVASVTTPEPQLLQITPFDASNLKAISDAISADQSLGLNPSDDGRVVRIQIPPLTEETRQSMVKVVGQKLEDCLITARNVRHEGLHQLDTAEKEKAISKDDRLRTVKQIDDLIAQHKTEVEGLAKAKEQEITTL